MGSFLRRGGGFLRGSMTSTSPVSLFHSLALNGVRLVNEHRATFPLGSKKCYCLSTQSIAATKQIQDRAMLSGKKQ